MEDRKISDIQRINLISKIASSDNLFDILTAIKNELDIEMPELDYKLSDSEKINHYKQDESLIEKIPAKELVESPLTNTSVVTTPKEASIYREEAKPLVEQDKLDHPVKEISKEVEAAIQDEVQEETIVNEETVSENPKILERTINNNPWSGIETVSPGQLKL